METVALFAVAAKAAFQTLIGIFTLWPVWLVLAASLVMKLGPELYDRWRLRRAGMPEVDQMTGLEFEKFLQYLFERQGYVVERTRLVGDYGGDLILRKDGTRTLVQAKRWRGNVGPKAVQEAAAARPHYNCNSAMVVTNRHFTKAARELAASNHIDLWDRSKLAGIILASGVQHWPGRRVNSDAAAREVAATAVGVRVADVEGSNEIGVAPSCPRCGQPMVLRRSRSGRFWGCSRYPSCRGIVPIDR